MPKKRKQQDKVNPALGFLLGLGAGTIVYAFLSLFAKSECRACGATIERSLDRCPNCDAKLKYWCILSDIFDNLNRLFNLYDRELRLSGILTFTAILIGGVILLYIDSTPIPQVDGNMEYNRFLPENIRLLIVGFVVAHMLGLYIYSRNLKEKLRCPNCQAKTLQRCDKCGWPRESWNTDWLAL